MKQVLHIEEPPRAAPPGGFALLQLGFRPFYLLASIFAALSIGLWALQFTGLLQGAYLKGPLWHAHEMVFGFAVAVIVGFLFTAGRNWSNLPTPTGWKLGLLAAVWIAGRVLVLTPYGWAAALVNAAFPAAAAVALAIPFIASRNRRNYFFIGLLVLLSLATLAIHMQQLGALDMPPWAGVQLALDIVLFIMAVMGGRVIPMFTNNGVRGAAAMRVTWLERIALGSLMVLLAADALALAPVVVATCAGVCAVAHFARWWLWQPWVTLRTPLVWVLHLAYLWIPIHLALRTLALLGAVTPSVAVHALTVGAMGGLIIGMMTRTARGHTARPLRADRWDVACYVLVAAAAVVRVGVPLMKPEWLIGSVQLSAVLWSAGFGLYAIAYWKVLTRPRLDGKPG
jgi:uncharacterized protein involved in response to NO